MSNMTNRNVNVIFLLTVIVSVDVGKIFDDYFSSKYNKWKILEFGR